jgi:hypothetical protein
VTALSSLIDAGVALVLGVAALAVADVPLADVAVPLGTVLVSASFAIGAPITAVVLSLLFVLRGPFDVGDRVTASGVLGGEELLLVRRIDLLTTTFLRPTAREITVPNAELWHMAIENLKRSPPANVRLDLSVSTSTSAKSTSARPRKARSRASSTHRSAPCLTSASSSASPLYTTRHPPPRGSRPMASHTQRVTRAKSAGACVAAAMSLSSVVGAPHAAPHCAAPVRKVVGNALRPIRFSISVALSPAFERFVTFIQNRRALSPCPQSAHRRRCGPCATLRAVPVALGQCLAGTPRVPSPTRYLDQ